MKQATITASRGSIPKNSASSRPEKLLSIQILRGIAALSVFFYHLNEPQQWIGRSASSFFDSGQAGVDIFFVISGFVIFTSTERRSYTPYNFIKDRIIRIAPMYYIFTITYLIAKYMTNTGPFTYQITDFIYSFLFIPYTNSINGQPVPILGVGWTLNYEVMFYAIFSVSLLIKNIETRIIIVSLSFFALIAGRFLLTPTDAFALRVTSPILLEFLAGIVLAYAFNKRRIITAPQGLMAISASLLTFGLAYESLSDLPRTLGYGVPAILLVLGFIACEKHLAKPAFAPLRLVGDASYSIYLTHVIVILCATSILSRHDSMSFSDKASITIITILIGWACYRFIEAPLLRAMRSIIR
ncbi:O-acetyltransferase OatA [Hartmannibacter diazotrophicus]|uniref:O-acetyltransferase OatA n=1 Tax=Hartmannibacter diazotrophicus TaxID=1482074 RepID=A0A2C9D5D0_9HYPH|nr:acyltransferase [Hartmannibacter diazotrophicus]SON55552.1 O-acetyltransferase OatA [Hartmannibacter diazotrophicus]